jgi:hypothetical protein
MKPQYDHNLGSYLTLYLENKILDKGEAFTNTTGQFFPSDQNSINGLDLSNSAYSQWVYDKSITGAIVPTGIFVNGQEVGRGTSGVSLDFLNGAAYHDTFGSTNISGAFAFKDFNFYFKPENETQVLLRNAFRSKDPLQVLTGSNNLKINAPCIIVSSRNSSSSPLAFGGLDEINYNYQALVLSDNSYDLDGALSIFRDTREEYFPVGDFEKIPWNAKGDLKNDDYNYNTMTSAFSGTYDKAFIENVIVNNTNSASSSDDAFSEFNIGLVEFNVLVYRFPRN